MNFIDSVRVNDVNHGEQERRCLRSGGHCLDTYKILLQEDLILLCTSTIIHKFALNKPCDRMDTSFCYDVDPFFAFCPFAKSCRHRRGKLVLMNQVLIHEGTPKSERERERESGKQE